MGLFPARFGFVIDVIRGSGLGTFMALLFFNGCILCLRTWNDTDSLLRDFSFRSLSNLMGNYLNDQLCGF